jgi:hypothetical protein
MVLLPVTDSGMGTIRHWETRIFVGIVLEDICKELFDPAISPTKQKLFFSLLHLLPLGPAV